MRDVEPESLQQCATLGRTRDDNLQVRERPPTQQAHDHRKVATRLGLTRTNVFARKQKNVVDEESARFCANSSPTLPTLGQTAPKRWAGKSHKDARRWEQKPPPAKEGSCHCGEANDLEGDDDDRSIHATAFE